MKRFGKSAVMAVSVAAMLLGLLVTAGSVARAGDADVIAQAQKLFDEEKFEDANKLLMELAKTNPDHPDVYWKIGQIYYELGERIDIAKDKDKKLELYKQCEAWAKKGYDKDPGLADNSFWMAVGMSQQAQTNGIVSTLMSDRTLAARIEKFYLEASQAKEFHYKAENADTVSAANYALGMFYRKIPDSYIVRVLMGTKGDIGKSIEHHTKALTMYPKNIEYNKELGVSYLCRYSDDEEAKDLEAAKKHLNAALALPAKNSLDRIDHADCKKLLADPSLACGYSRVQQEDVSEDAFKDK